MGWKYRSDDNSIEVIVDPNFRGDIGTLASTRPVWIVDSPHNGPAIDAVWADGPQRNLIEVNRYPYTDTDNRIGKLEAECFRVTGLTPDGFVAIQDTAARDRLIGRA